MRLMGLGLDGLVNRSSNELDKLPGRFLSRLGLEWWTLLWLNGLGLEWLPGLCLPGLGVELLPGLRLTGLDGEWLLKLLFKGLERLPDRFLTRLGL